MPDQIDEDIIFNLLGAFKKNKTEMLSGIELVKSEILTKLDEIELRITHMLARNDQWRIFLDKIENHPSSSVKSQWSDLLMTLKLVEPDPEVK